MGSSSVPVIDLSRPNRAIVQTVLEACTTAGFFVVSNHGVAQHITDHMFQQNAQFFALPDDEKAKIRVNNINRYIVRQSMGQMRRHTCRQWPLAGA